jgi:hypothetical protein
VISRLQVADDEASDRLLPVSGEQLNHGSDIFIPFFEVLDRLMQLLALRHLQQVASVYFYPGIIYPDSVDFII